MRSTAGTVEHYEKHLGQIYAWMVGDFTDASNEMSEYFDTIGLRPFSTGRAIDLGCGHGLQSIPLANRGFSVIAVDSCQQLLDTLREHAGKLPIEPVHGDLLEFAHRLDAQLDAVICMGDTLTHLASLEDVERLVSAVADSLVDDGMFCTSFRDYVSTEPAGTARFIPVRSDDQMIHTCFLEFGTDVVYVHDLVYKRVANVWEFSAGVYEKLRLSPQLLIEMAQNQGLELAHETTNRGMIFNAFRRRPPENVT